MKYPYLMKHLDDFQLNEYLDGALDAGQHPSVENHLATCAQCSEHLEALRRVVGALAALPDEPLENDLSVGVQAQVAKLSPRRQFSPRLAWLLAGQGLVAMPLALAALAWMWPKLVPAGEKLSAWGESLAAVCSALMVGWPGEVHILQTAWMPHLPANEWLQLPGAAWGVVLACALGAWLLGSRLAWHNGASYSTNSKRRL